MKGNNGGNSFNSYLSFGTTGSSNSILELQLSDQVKCVLTQNVWYIYNLHIYWRVLLNWTWTDKLMICIYCGEDKINRPSSYLLHYIYCIVYTVTAMTHLQFKFIYIFDISTDSIISFASHILHSFDLSTICNAYTQMCSIVDLFLLHICHVICFLHLKQIRKLYIHKVRNLCVCDMWCMTKKKEWSQNNKYAM